MKKILLVVYILSALVFAKAEIFMPKIFSDNMVLQRQIPVRIWGKADAGAIVGIEFAGQKIETKADRDGSWRISLRPLKASLEPQIMRFYENGALAKEIENILVGEVWISGGQSNMQWSLKQLSLLKDDLKRGENPLIRVFTQKHDAGSATPQFNSPQDAKWELSNADNFRDFSAISFFFAETLSAELKVPIAIVQTALGGTKMAPWLAIEDVKKSPAFKKELSAFEKVYDPNYNYEETLSKWEADRKDYAARKKQASIDKVEFKEIAPRKPSEFATMPLIFIPSYLYNAKIAPIAGYSARAFLWYQGESDVGDVDNFSEKFETLINSWRKYWDRAMPFYFVQLPSYGKASESWAKTRWEQYITKAKLRLVEMAVSIDTGDEKNIHPADKEEISKRLAKIAQKRLYGNRLMTGDYGPMFRSASYAGNKVVIGLNMFGRKLKQDGDLRGFEILVDDNWVSPELANVDLGKAVVVLNAPDGKEIKAVRYLWKAWAKPDICLYSDLNIPLATFFNKKKTPTDFVNEALESNSGNFLRQHFLQMMRRESNISKRQEMDIANKRPVMQISRPMAESRHNRPSHRDIVEQLPVLKKKRDLDVKEDLKESETKTEESSKEIKETKDNADL